MGETKREAQPPLPSFGSAPGGPPPAKLAGAIAMPNPSMRNTAKTSFFIVLIAEIALADQPPLLGACGGPPPAKVAGATAMPSPNTSNTAKMIFLITLTPDAASWNCEAVDVTSSS